MQGERLPASSLQHDVVIKMVEDGVVQRIQSGKSKAWLLVNNKDLLQQYLSNRFSIHHLQSYIEKYNEPGITRSEAVIVSGNSKLKSIRTFKGFLVNSTSVVQTTLRGQAFYVSPSPGSFVFIHDYESFVPHPAITIVGIENPENFFSIYQQQYLFENIQPLFISRYPQGNDIIKWLKMIPNPYLHYGDFDFEGINIYLNEYKKHLQERASFFVPGNVEDMIEKYGNRELYNKQLHRQPAAGIIQDTAIQNLVTLFHKYKKVLEQEVYIINQ